MMDGEEYRGLRGQVDLSCGEINGLRIDNFFDLTPPLQFLVKKPNPLFVQRQRLPRSWIIV